MADLDSVYELSVDADWLEIDQPLDTYNPQGYIDREYDKVYIMYQYMHQRVEEKDSYKHVKICNDWYDIEVFREDIQSMSNYGEQGWELDKDLFSPKGSPVYSKDTCCFLPKLINQQLRKLKYLEKHNRLPYTNYHKTKGWYATVKLCKEDKVQYFNHDIEAFLYARDIKSKFLINLANEYKSKLPDYIYKELVSYKIGFEH